MKKSILDYLLYPFFVGGVGGGETGSLSKSTGFFLFCADMQDQQRGIKEIGDSLKLMINLLCQQ